jgi:hypothetical protein
MTCLFPILNCKVLDVNMPGVFGRTVSIDHGRLVVFKQRGGFKLFKTELTEDGTKVFGHFSSRDSCKKLGFSGAGGRDGLCLASVCYDAASKHKAITGGGASMAKVITMCSINVADELKWIEGGGERRQGRIIFQRLERNMGKERVWLWTPIDDTPINGIAEVFGNTFQLEIVDLIGGRSELGEGSNRKTYVKAGGDVCIKKFAKKESAIGKAHFFFKGGMGRSMFFVTGMLIKELDVARW